MKTIIVEGIFRVLQRTGLTLFLLCLFFSHNQLLLKAENVSVEENMMEIDLTKNNQNTLQRYLDYLSLGLIGFSEDEKFKEILYKEIQKRFDDDYNVLINTLIEECKINGIDLIQEMENYIYLNYQETIDFNSILNKCKIKGLYPQIYIPIFEVIEKNRLTIDSLRGKTPVILADRVSKNKNPFYQGKHFNRKNMRTEDLMVNEEYAQNNEVWVVAFNERVDENGKRKSLDNIDLNKGEEYANVQSSVGRDLKILKISCPDLSALEGWTRGGPELYLRVYCCKQGEFTSGYFTGKRSQFQYPSWYYANKILRYWDYNLNGENLYFFWYEGDGLYDAKNTYTFNFGCDGNVSSYTVKTNYQDEYAGGRVVNKSENLIFQTDLDLVRWTLLSE